MIRDRQARGVGRIVAIFVLIGIAAANSALFYFVIWPEFSPNDPFSAILFFISGGAHLIYFFIPWFVVDVIGATFGTGGEDPTKYETQLGGDTAGYFMRICIVVGGLSSVIVVLLSLLEDQLRSDPPPTPVTITRANCLYAGGVATMIGGRLTCSFETQQSAPVGGTEPAPAGGTEPAPAGGTQ